MTITAWILPAVAVLLVIALGGTLLFYLMPQREILRKQTADLDNEREQLKAQTDARRKELQVEAREEALRFRGEVEQEHKDKRAELQRLEAKTGTKRRKHWRRNSPAWMDSARPWPSKSAPPSGTCRRRGTPKKNRRRSWSASPA